MLTWVTVELKEAVFPHKAYWGRIAEIQSFDSEAHMLTVFEGVVAGGSVN